MQETILIAIRLSNLPSSRLYALLLRASDPFPCGLMTSHVNLLQHRNDISGAQSDDRNVCAGQKPLTRARSVTSRAARFPGEFWLRSVAIAMRLR